MTLPPPPHPHRLPPPDPAGRLIDRPVGRPRRNLARHVQLLTLGLLILASSAVGLGSASPVARAATTSLSVAVGEPTGTVADGEVITYSVTVTNPGTDAVNGVGVTANLSGTATCPTTVLAAGQSMVCSFAHTVTAAEVTAGTLDLIVNAAGVAVACTVAPLTADLPSAAGSPYTFSGIQENGADVAGFQWTVRYRDGAGNLVGYLRVRAESTGTLADSTLVGSDFNYITESLPGELEPMVMQFVWNTVANGYFAPNTHTLTGKGNLGTGSVFNNATAFTPNWSNRATGFTVISEDQPDEIINATTGDSLVAGTRYNLTDQQVYAGEAPQYVLGMGHDAIFSGENAEYRFDQWGGPLRREDHGIGVAMSGCRYTPTNVSGSGAKSITTWYPSIDLVKNSPTGTLAAGQTIQYSFDVTNTGNVELTSIALTDDLTADEACPSTTLASGAAMTCTASYVVTQADVDAGVLTNDASVIGYLPDATTTVTDTASVSAPITAAPAMTVAKTATPAGAAVGDTITYSIVVTNTGNVTLTNIAIADPLTTDESCPVTTLAPGASTACAATYVITPADADAGNVANTATLTALGPSGAEVSATGSNDYPVAQNPSLSVSKTAAPAGATVGDTITYTITVTNTGNVTLNSATIDDPMTADESCPPGAIAPGASIDCTATYTLTQADVDAGTVSNTATVTALDPNGASVTNSGSNSYTPDQTASLAMTKTGTVADPDGDGVPHLGDTVTYTITVTNTGAVTVDSVAVTDPMGSPICSTTSIGAGEMITCTLSHAVTQAELDAGVVNNTASASGTDPGATPVTADASATTALVQAPELTVTKSTPSQAFNAGDTIAYSIVVVNSGNVTIDNLAITDDMTPDETCPATTLAPGEQMVCTASHVATQADIDAGTLTNTAVVDGTDTNGGTVTNSGSASTPFAAAPSLSVSKSGTPVDVDADGMVEAGETISYTIIVTNTGNVTMSNLAVADPTAGTPTCDLTELLPGQNATCQVSYTLTQADVDAGVVGNTATADATAPDSTPTSATGNTTTEIVSDPAVSITKIGAANDADDNGRLDVGETIDYTITVTNRGNVTLDPVDVADPTVGTPTCDFTSLAPGVGGSCTATHTLTQADIDAGSFTNAATVTGVAPSEVPVTASTSVTNQIVADPSITLVKSGEAIDTNGNGAIEVGESIDYTITVTNTGNVTVSDLAVTDPTAGNPTCDVAALAAGEVATCTVSLTINQAHVDAGQIDNTATAAGVDPAGGAVNGSDTVSTMLATTASISMTKTGTWIDADADGIVDAGETIDFTIEVTNTGNVTVSSLAVTDPSAGVPVCESTTVAPGQTVNCTVAYTISQADADAGEVLNTATATGVGPSAQPVDGSASETVTLAASPQLSVAKTGSWVDTDVDGMVDAGEPIDYTITVTNSGNVTITNLVVTDPPVGTPTCDVSTLAPGEVATCTVSHAITEADIVAGSFANTADASGTDPTNGPVAGSGSTTNQLAAVPQIDADKNATLVDVNGDGVPAPGDRIDYTITVTNIGNVTISGLAVDDALTGAPTCGSTTLAPGTSTDCVVSYTLTTADVDLGSVVNTATASGSDPNGVAVADSSMATMPIDHVPSLEVTKSSTVDTFTVGSLVAYSIVVRNSGNVTVDGITITDDLTGDESCPSTVLATGEQMTCTATYTLTQADIDAGSTDNTATVSGFEPYDQSVSAADTNTTPFTQSPALSIAKTGTVTDDDDNGQIDAGETVSYVIRVINTGNVTVTGVAVSDPKLPDLTCDVTVLAPGMQATCQGAYAVTQSEIDAGVVSNTASVTAKDPNLADVTETVNATTAVVQRPALGVAKTGAWDDGDGDGMVDPGETIDYEIVVTNTGNVTASSLAVSDPRVGDPTCDVDALAPGEVATCVVSYVVTEADIVAGSVVNTASASATDPNDGAVSASGGTTTELAAVPAITATKTGTIVDVNGDGVTAAGDRIDYVVTVTNTGNVSATGLNVTDVLTGPPVCGLTDLAPGQATDCTVSYTLTQDDVDAGAVANTASVTATDPFAATVGAEASTTTTISPLPSLQVTKSSTIDTYTVGSVVSYSIVVRNSGNVTVDGITIADDLTPDESCPSTSLAPGDQMTCTATYTLTQADIDTGSTDNTATVSGTDPDGGAVSNVGTATTPYTQSPQLSMTKTGTPNDTDANGHINAGDIVSYVIAVTNVGNVSVTNVTVADSMLADLSCDVNELAPGMVATCTGTYALTQADVDGGSVANTASVVAKDPNLFDVAADVTADTPIEREPTLTLDAAGTHGDTNADGVFQAGETIEYTAIVTNTGNVNITSLVVTDPVLGTFTCNVDALAPGESATCTVSYPLTQSDVDAGRVNVSPVANGTDPGDGPVTASDVVDTAAPAVPGLTVLKAADVANPAVGDTITYTITVANTGNVTMTNIVVTDDLTADETCSGSTVAPGETITCTATYVVTQDDVDRGSLLNSATATGVTPGGDTVQGSGDHTTPFDQRPAVAAVKVAVFNDESGDGLPQIGETIDYTITVTNTGNVTLVGVGVDDPIAGNPVCGATVLAPADATDCRVVYTLTAADIDAAGVTNVATATATAPDGSEPTTEAAVTTTLTQASGLDVAKSGTLDDTNENGVPDPGEAMTYTIVITNTGNVTLANVAVTDTLVADPGCDLAQLAAGAQAECRVGYTLTQADIDSGEIANTAGVAATAPDGTPIEATDTALNPLTAAPSIDLTMSGSIGGGATVTQPGAPVDYVFVVTNTGNVTLHDVTVTDGLPSEVTCPDAVLAAGARMTCTATYPLTQADIDAGGIVNGGAVTGIDPSDIAVDDVASVDLPLAADAALEVAKSGVVVDLDQSGLFGVGDSIEFTVTVTNTGNVTLTGIAVDDPLTGAPTCDAATIAPGEVATCTVSYLVSQSDIDAGVVTNTAAATAEQLESPVEATTDVTLPKAADDSATGMAGQPVVVDVLGNDSNHLDPATLRLIDADGNPVLSVDVPGEGTWTVADGQLVFTPADGFVGTTTPVTYLASGVDGVVVTATATAVLSPLPTTTTTTPATTSTTTSTTTLAPGDGTTTTFTVTTTPYYPDPPVTGMTGGPFALVASGSALVTGLLLLLASRVGRRRSEP